MLPIVASILTSGCISTSLYKTSTSNMENPTSYEFDTDWMTVLETLESMVVEFRTRKTQNEWGLIREEKRDKHWKSKLTGRYLLFISRHASKYHTLSSTCDSWGNLGEVSGSYLVTLKEITPEKTLVELKNQDLTMVVGSELSFFNGHGMFPNLHRNWKKIRSATVFEYKFLRKLGSHLGQADMPPIKL